MANRFSQWASTNYVELPTDMYQTALAAREQQGLTDLDASKKLQDQLEGVQAISNSGEARKREHMDDLTSKIEGLAKRNLGTQESLMELKKVVFDKNRINDFYAISKEAANYKKLLKEAEAYTKEYGNDINIDEFKNNWAEYNKSSNSKDFNPRLLEGVTINKYIPIVENLRESIGKFQKESGEEIVGQSPDGTFFTKSGRKGITAKELFGDAAEMLRDPTYQNQINTYLKYYARRNGENGNVENGIQVMGKQYAENQILNKQQQILNMKQNLKNMVADQKNKDSKVTKEDIEKSETMIKDAETEMATVRKKLDEGLYEQTDYSGFARQSLLNTLISSAIAPLDHSIATQDVPTLNPLAKEERDWWRKKEEIRLNMEAGIEGDKQKKINEHIIDDMYANKDNSNVYGQFDNTPANDNEVSAEINSNFGNLGVSSDGSELSISRDSPLSAINELAGGLSNLVSPGTYHRGANRTIGIESVNNLINFAKQYDSEGFNNFFPQGAKLVSADFTGIINAPTPEQERYLVGLYSKIKTATANDMANKYAAPMVESNGFDEQKVKGYVMNSLLGGTLKKVYVNGKIDNSFKIKNLLENSSDPDDKTRTYEALIKDSQVQITAQGEFSVNITGTDGNVYKILVDAPQQTKDFFQSQDNLLNPSFNPNKTKTPGFAKGFLFQNNVKIPIFNQMSLNLETSKFEPTLYTPKTIPIIGTDKKEIQMPITIDPNNITACLIYPVIQSYGDDVVTWVSNTLNNSKPNEIIKLDLGEKRKLNPNSKNSTSDIINFIKDENGAIVLLNGFNRNNEDMRMGIMNTYKMNNPQFKLKAKK